MRQIQCMCAEILMGLMDEARRAESIGQTSKFNAKRIDLIKKWMYSH